jgi:DNA-binding Xre family transcriptional regulator
MDTYTDSVITWRLQEFMEQHAVTQYALQKKSGVALNTIKGIYNRKTKRPDLEVLDRIISALGELVKHEVRVSDVLEYKRG